MLCKIWGFHGCDYEEWLLLGYKNPVPTSQEIHYISATESSRVMLCKIWSFHGSDYEECRLLRYKNSVRTSQETHYLSATEPSRVMLCKIWGFHGGYYEECRRMVYGVTTQKMDIFSEKSKKIMPKVTSGSLKNIRKSFFFYTRNLFLHK
jgi:hypothetical protein